MSDAAASSPADPIDTLRALQRASLAEGVGAEGSVPAFAGRNFEAVIRSHLIKEGYDLKRNSLETALRAWQVRHGLHGDGFGPDGRPDVVTQTMLSHEMQKKEPLQLAQQFALDDLTRHANQNPPNKLGLDKVFERAGLAGAAPSAASADPLGDFIRTIDTPRTTEAAPEAAAETTGPDIGAAVGRGAEAVRGAVGRGAAAVRDTFKKLGDKAQPTAPDPAAAAEEARLKAEREAQLKAAGDAIQRRAGELRQGVGAAVEGASDALGDIGARLKSALGGGKDDKPAAEGGAAPAPSKPPPKFD